MSAVKRAIVIALTTGALVGCGDQGSARTPARPASPPAYQIATSKDVSMGAVRRLQVKVSLPEHYSKNDVETVAQAVVADITKAQPVNAISILFYGPGTSTAGVYDVAMAEWAPNGR
jgi:hypothetical protein